MSSLGAQMTEQDIRRNNEGILSRCEPGDLIEFPRGTFSHWAVYVGDEKVIHLTQVTDNDASGKVSKDSSGGGNGSSSSSNLGSLSSKSSSGGKLDKAGVREDSFWDVVGNSLARINNYLDGKKNVFPGPRIEARARQPPDVDYDALNYNCEHFATWCRYGEAISKQAENFEAGVASAILVGAALSAVSKKQ